MGLFDRFLRWGEGRRAKEARARELAGDLASAATLYVEAEMPDDAARVLLLRADAEGSVEQRIAFCDVAARTAKSEEIQKRALGRKARLTLDVIRARGGASLKSELARVARDLEGAGELERAAEIYAELGDAESEIRVLTEMGAIEKLEERLKASHAESRKVREVTDVRRRVADLDRTAERRAALEVARAALAERDDDVVADAARAIRARLATGPLADLEIGGKFFRVALGEEVTIGRGEATILIGARAVSRTHLRIRREGSEIFVEDLDTRNGTMLAGARIQGAIPVSQGIRLELGGEVPCGIERPTASPEQDLVPDGVIVTVAGMRFLAPLGPLVVGALHVDRVVHGDSGFVVLRTPSGAPRPILGEFELAAEVELCMGDEIRASRGGPVVLRVAAGSREGSGSGA
ncbi:FHA domain-containing protein [Polyangium sp. y55x31]|uniref:FHA domain-containing protein n=1 Tax=Polyangium sp. y55x31 TaxID=3042688 RepID=UPI002482821B|nr:FHA domain-containing protein [Polyangium sp. y55x31]MDI1475850.1 FHA domain-containing protein [Polyangium sp. y55x31]